MNDPAQSQVAGQVEAILVPTVERQDAQLRPARGARRFPRSRRTRRRRIAFIKWFTSKDFQIENYAERRSADTHLGAGRPQRCRQAASAATSLVEQSKIVEPLFAQGTPTWYPQFSSAVNTAINGVAKGQITVDQAMQNIADATQKAMAQ